MFHYWKAIFQIAWVMSFRASSFSVSILRIAAITLAISLAVMLSTLALVSGFQSTISGKLYAIWGNYRVLPTTSNNESMGEYYGFERNMDLEQSLNKAHIKYDIFSSVFVICQTTLGAEGMVMKSFFKSNRWDEFLVEKINEPMDTTAYTIHISKTFATQYKLKLGDALYIHSAANTPTNTRIRKMKITGIYHTGILEYDKKVIHCPTHILQKMHILGIGGYEVFLSPHTHFEEREKLNHLFYTMPIEWSGIAIEKLLPDLFDWIEYAKSTEYLFVSILSILIFMNLVTSFLLFVVDRSKMIGVLLAIGYSKTIIRKIIFVCGFLWSMVGMSVGIVLSLLFLWGQKKFGWIQLNAEVHYLELAMVDINVQDWLIVIVCVWLVCMLGLWMPAYIASRFNPGKILRFN